jgi:predicted alpha/beta superfamily hydrolase
MKKFIIAIALVINAFCVNAQQLKLSTKVDIKLRSKSEQTEHSIYVQLPKSYGKLHTQFPVIVLLDAQDKTLFDYASATIDRLMYTNDIPEAIFVGVVQNDRGKELSVERNEESALKFQHFLKTELYNYLQDKYQAGSYITFIGHSLGGQFVTNALASDPDFFKSVISISGALNYPPDHTFFKRKVLGNLRSYLIRNYSGNPEKQKYYFSAGTDGYQDSGFKSGALNADSLLKLYPNNSLNWKFDYLPGFNHMTTPLHSIPAGLAFIFKDWHFTDSLAMEVLLKQTIDPIDAIRKQRKQIKNSYGTALALPYNTYYQFAMFYIQQGNLLKARVIGQDIIEQYPDEDESYSLMAEIFTKQGNKSEALRYYKIAQSKSQTEKYSKEITELALRK